MKKKVCFVIISLSFVIGCIIVYKNNDKFTNKIINYNGNNLMISIDGNTSTTLPTNGDYYLASYDCKSSKTKVTWNNSTYQLNISNGNKRSGVSCYLEFETNPKLSNMEVGSYVSYTGNNGCSGNACSGQNANYVSNTDMGYCSDKNYKFMTNGWRIAYIKGGSVYLISAGAPECICSNSDGTTSNVECNSYESTVGASLHLQNLNDKALTYCNKNYVYNGICDEDSTWSMGATDFQNITGKVLSNSSCLNISSDVSCGYNNDLIDNGGYYWYATSNDSSANVFQWYPNYRQVNLNSSNNLYGVRPVIRLDSNVVVIDGDGTIENPYEISNNAFWINDGATTISNSSKSSIALTLISVDAVQMCISTDTSVCTNYIDFATSYTLDWSDETAGEKLVYVYYKNSAGRVIAALSKSVILSAS